MALTFVDYPRYVPPDGYERAIERILERLRRVKGLVSVYQVGGVDAPGISDIDLLAVFEEDAVVTWDPRAGLSRDDRYLFMHRLLGVSRRHFSEAQRYTLYHHYRLRWGEALPLGGSDFGPVEVAQLKRQIALEFLVWNYVAKAVDKAYGMASVRELLLTVYALRHDMEYLAVVEGSLFDLIRQVVAWRHVWFEKPLDGDALNAWFAAFYPALHAFLTVALDDQKLFIPAWASPRYAPHIRLVRGETLACAHRGIMLPLGTPLPPRAYRLTMHALNRFRFTIPATDRAGDVLQDRFRVLRTVTIHNGARLKRFDSPGSALTLRLLPGRAETPSN